MGYNLAIGKTVSNLADLGFTEIKHKVGRFNAQNCHIYKKVNDVIQKTDNILGDNFTRTTDFVITDDSGKIIEQFQRNVLKIGDPKNPFRKATSIFTKKTDPNVPVDYRYKHEVSELQCAYNQAKPRVFFIRETFQSPIETKKISVLADTTGRIHHGTFQDSSLKLPASFDSFINEGGFSPNPLWKKQKMDKFTDFRDFKSYRAFDSVTQGNDGKIFIIG